MQAISGAAQATGVSQTHPYETAGELAAALDEFDVSYYGYYVVSVKGECCQNVYG